jgi:hypothetical protein
MRNGLRSLGEFPWHRPSLTPNTFTSCLKALLNPRCQCCAFIGLIQSGQKGGCDYDRAASWLVRRNLRHRHCHIPYLRLGAGSGRRMIEVPHYFLTGLFAALIILSPRR